MTQPEINTPTEFEAVDDINDINIGDQSGENPPAEEGKYSI